MPWRRRETGLFETSVSIYHSNGNTFQEIAVVTITNLTSAFWCFLRHGEGNFNCSFKNVFLEISVEDNKFRLYFLGVIKPFTFQETYTPTDNCCWKAYFFTGRDIQKSGCFTTKSLIFHTFFSHYLTGCTNLLILKLT